MSSFGFILDQNKGLGRGFDFLRVTLALFIVLHHALTVTGHYYDLDQTPMWLLHYALVPMFFALSGFLVSASACRLSLRDFITNRAMRIIPALAVDTFFCVLIVGPAFTKSTIYTYYTSRETFSFFLNIFGYVHFYLPGVFTDHPIDRVNGSLWTVPFEIMCYIIICVMIKLKAMSSKILAPAIVISYLIISVIISYFNIISLFDSKTIQKAVSVAFVEYEAQAVTAFICGIIAYQNRYVIKYSPLIFLLCCLLLIILALTLTGMQAASPIYRILLLPTLTYVTIYVGLTPLELPRFFRTGDYSYGIYLYHQPFLQMVVALAPGTALVYRWGAFFTFLTAIPFVLGMAWMSWHFVESPILALRKRRSLTIKPLVDGDDKPIELGGVVGQS